MSETSEEPIDGREYAVAMARRFGMLPQKGKEGEKGEDGESAPPPTNVDSVRDDARVRFAPLCVIGPGPIEDRGWGHASILGGNSLHHSGGNGLGLMPHHRVRELSRPVPVDFGRGSKDSK